MRKITLLLILLLAFTLRFYQLGNFPNSIDWDEAALGYNAYSILKTAKDEYGIFLPLQFKSFGDYKPPFYVYSAIPSVAFFDLTEFAVRLPSAFFGFLGVVFVYLLVKQLFPSLNKKYHYLILFLLAISPWHIQFSRVAFEANTGLTWFILGTLLFMRISVNRWNLLFSAIAFVISVYSYHSLRLVTPIFVCGLIILFRQEILKRRKVLLLTSLFILISLFPLILLMSQGVGARFSSVSNIKPETLNDSIDSIVYDDTNVIVY